MQVPTFFEAVRMTPPSPVCGACKSGGTFDAWPEKPSPLAETLQFRWFVTIFSFHDPLRVDGGLVRLICQTGPDLWSPSLLHYSRI